MPKHHPFASPRRADSLSLLSWNIQRWDTRGLLTPPWRYRRRRILGVLENLSPDVVGLQEILQPVVSEVRAALPHHGWVGVARGDGMERGEYAPILYDRRRLSRLESGWFWLAEAPDRPTIGWDARLPRIATWARFTAGHRSFFVLNTHFDHRGVQARRRSAWLILAESLRRSRGDPVVLMGDFNAREDDPPLRTLGLVLTNGASDGRRRHQGPRTTHPAGRIDHILYSRRFAPAELTTVPAMGASDHNALYYRLDLELAPEPIVA